MPGPERNKAMAEQGMVYDIGLDEFVKDEVAAARYLTWLAGKSKTLPRSDYWADEFAKSDARIDSTLRIRLPNDFIDKSPLVVGGLTRFDPSTKARVPVTQEWVDEAVAEIVRLNVELMEIPASDSGVTLSDADRIWEAVRAASAV